MGELQPLDADIARLAQAAMDSGLAPVHQVDVAEARRRVVAGAINARPGPASVRVEEAHVAGVRVRTYSVGQPICRIVYAHGGGWVTGNLDTLDGYCRYLAADLPAVVTSVDYRLAPESPFPSGLEDVWSVYESLVTLDDDVPLVVAGDSAGANLCAVVARRARDRGMSEPTAQLLAYPVTDQVRPDRDSYRDCAESFPLGIDAMRYFWSVYAPDVAEGNVEAFPLQDADFTGLAPAFVVLAGHDPLHDEGSAYAAALREAGGRSEVRDFSTLCHGFLRMDGASVAAAAAMDSIINDFRQWFTTFRGDAK